VLIARIECESCGRIDKGHGRGHAAIAVDPVRAVRAPSEAAHEAGNKARRPESTTA
jgi:hypothetical protein